MISVDDRSADYVIGLARKTLAEGHDVHLAQISTTIRHHIIDKIALIGPEDTVKTLRSVADAIEKDTSLYTTLRDSYLMSLDLVEGSAEL